MGEWFRIVERGLVGSVKDFGVFSLDEDVEVNSGRVLSFGVGSRWVDEMKFEFGEFVDVVVYGVVDLMFSLFSLDSC